MNCATCGAPVTPGQLCGACGTMAPRSPSEAGGSDRATTQSAPSGPARYWPTDGGQGAPAYGAPIYPAPTYGAAAQGLPTYRPVFTPPTGDPPRTNGLAIASLVCSLVGGFLCGLGSIVGVVLGLVARAQIRRSGGSQTGEGLALAGIVIGCIFVLLTVAVFTVALIALLHNNNGGAG